MLKNNLKITLRNFARHPSYSLINITGLAVGMACSILILLYVQDEMSYDRYHENADRIYRVVADSEVNGRARQFANAPSGAGQSITEELPEVLNYTRLFDLQFVTGETLVKYGKQKFHEAGVMAADPTFFDIFSYDFMEGDPETALDHPGSVVITEETATRLFGDDEAMGKTVHVALQGDVGVTGVIKAVPKNSHFTFNYMLSSSSLQGEPKENIKKWLDFSGYTYVLLAEGAEPESIQSRFAAIVDKNLPESTRQAGFHLTLGLQKLTDIHLHSHRQFEIAANSELVYIYIFSVIALLVLLIACINFMSLSTARSTHRAKEVGLRKVCGAHKRQLIKQFLAESITLSTFALIIGVVLVGLVLPLFNRISDKELAIDFLSKPEIILGLLTLVSVVGLGAGSYPAFFLSAFQPVATLKGKFGSQLKGGGLRKVFVILQFAISVFLIISTFLVIDQLTHMKNQKLGFQKDGILVLNVQKRIPTHRYETVTSELLRHPGVRSASIVSSVPGRAGVIRRYLPEGRAENETHVFDTILADLNAVQTFGMEMAFGRDLSKNFATDSSGALLINETAAKKLGWRPEEAVGKMLNQAGRGGMTESRIVGVIKDFHYKSLKQSIEPVVVRFDDLAGFAGGYIPVRFNTENISDVLAFLSQKWQELEPDQAFDYFFLDADFDKQYRAEERLAQICTAFGAVAIFVACLGLFGLSAYSAEQRTKEIGIRKVLGASMQSILTLFSTEFVKLVLIANLIAWPLAYLANLRWLQEFAFRVDIHFSTFLIAGLTVLIIATLTVSYQSLKAAMANPVDSLRQE